MQSTLNKLFFLSSFTLHPKPLFNNSKPKLIFFTNRQLQGRICFTLHCVQSNSTLLSNDYATYIKVVCAKEISLTNSFSFP